MYGNLRVNVLPLITVNPHNGLFHWYELVTESDPLFFELALELDR